MHYTPILKHNEASKQAVSQQLNNSLSLSFHFTFDFSFIYFFLFTATAVYFCTRVCLCSFILLNSIKEATKKKQKRVEHPSTKHTAIRIAG